MPKCPFFCRLLVDRTAKIERFDDRFRTQIEYLLHRLFEQFVRNNAGAERLDAYGNGSCDADRIGDLQLAALRKLCGNDVLCDVSCHIGRASVDLGRILTRERSAAVTRIAAVCVDDDLASGQSRIALRTADHKASGRIHQHAGLFIEQSFGQRRTDDIFDHIRFQLFVRDVLVMLCGNDDGVDVHRLVVRVFDRHLRFSVGTQISQRAVLTDLGELSRQRMRKVDRQRHQNGCFVTGIAEHHALIARTGIQRVAVDAVFAFERTVDAERDVVRLPVKRDDHAAGAAVEAELCAVITDVAHRFAHDALDVHITLGRDLAHDEHKTGRAGGFACHACVRILFQDRVKHGVADLVADLVGMTDRDRFAGKK